MFYYVTNMNLFMKRYIINHNIKEVFSYFTRPGILNRLIPPYKNIFVLKQEGIATDSITELQIKEFLFKLKWVSKHIDYKEFEYFADKQIKGPFKEFIHFHQFNKIDDNKTELIDEIKFILPFEPFSKPFKKYILVDLDKMLNYRYQIIENDLDLEEKYKIKKKNIVITGSSGVLGNYLFNYLSSLGHNVVRIRRDKKDKNSILWDLNNHYLSSCLNCTDIVIHLAGEPILEGKWTEEKKKRIIESRVETTKFLAEKISNMKTPPELFISASAIGFYGNRGDEILTENSESGSGFLPLVCKRWEEATKPAMKKGVRTAILRIGVTLTPAGGALKNFLDVFRFKISPVFSKDDIWLSWISPDDIAYSIIHIIANENLSGPINIISPNPIKMNQLIMQLKALLKPKINLKVPEKFIKLILKEKAEEILFSSTRVYPEKLIDSGFEFKYPNIENALRHALGFEIKE